MEMERIASFSIDHDKLEPGLYVSREDFGDIVTYDLRFKKPNQGDYLQMEAAHTIEHIFATYIRSCGIGSSVVYFGPMGCMTGFYLILKGVPKSEAIAWVQKGMEFVAGFEGDIPGASQKECGNYRAQSLPGAKAEAKRYAAVIGQWSEADLEY